MDSVRSAGREPRVRQRWAHLWSGFAYWRHVSEPRSKLAVERWVGRRVAIDGLEDVSAHSLYRAMDFLTEHTDEIQRAVFFSVATLLDLEVDLLFFYTPSTYLEIEDEDEGEEALRRPGRYQKVRTTSR